jgi:hypothetical protein
MVGQILQSRLRPPIIFAGDEDEAVGGDNLLRQCRHRGRRLALRIFLVHAVEHGEADRPGVDQFGTVAARADRIDQPVRQLDALPVAAVAAIKDEDRAGHVALSR